MIIGSAVCLWGFRIQPAVALSTREAEYKAITNAEKEILWLSRVAKEARWNVSSQTLIQSHNQLAIKWTTSKMSPPARANHNDVHAHFVRELEKTFLGLCIKFVTTKTQLIFLPNQLTGQSYIRCWSSWASVLPWRKVEMTWTLGLIHGLTDQENLGKQFNLGWYYSFYVGDVEDVLLNDEFCSQCFGLICYWDMDI